MDNMQNMGGNMGGMKNMCKCPHHKVVPGAIMLIGLSFLLGTWGILTSGAVDTIWPILLIIIGGMKMMKGNCKCCSM